MSKPTKVLYASGQAKLRSMYKCMCCGTESPGTEFTIQFDTFDLPWMVQRLTSPPAEPRNMPYHWSSHTEGFKCPKCNGNQARGT